MNEAAKSANIKVQPISFKGSLVAAITALVKKARTYEIVLSVTTFGATSTLRALEWEQIFVALIF
jgi:hypothetical protein